ncbi:MAG: DUF2937 family protein [Pseudomonadales bacterium]
MLYRYFTILLASALVVAGLQVTGFIDQYEQRLSAHFFEVANNLQGFQQIADQYHGGSLAALIEKHRQSPEATFSSEAIVIADMYNRLIQFEAAMAGLNTSLAGRIIEVSINADREIFDETISNYTYTITLNTDSAFCAGGLLVFGILLSDTLRLIIGRIFRHRRA